MKTIIGLDLGTTSVGFAAVREAETEGEVSSILKLGVRIVPLSLDEQTNFEKGKPITTNADRTLKHGMRLNLCRYKLRREHLLEVLQREGMISPETLLAENGNRSTFETYRLRAKAAHEEVSTEELARVLLMLNKKRGYKSNRKAVSEEETGALVDAMDVAQVLYERSITPGVYGYELLAKGTKLVPDFYRSDLQQELDRIWAFQAVFYPTILTPEFKVLLADKGKTAASKIFFGKYGVFTADNKGKERKLQAFAWRKQALEQELPIEVLAYVIADLEGAIAASSGYLGSISDRSKELCFTHRTVGEYLLDSLREDPNISLRNRIFYRKDYLDEFDQIWKTQAQFHPSLTLELKREIRDMVIFYQRRLKSKKHELAFCEFEQRSVSTTVEGKTVQRKVGSRVIPKSSPLFQEFKVWQVVNNLEVSDNSGAQRELSLEEKEALHEELLRNNSLEKGAVLKLLFKNPKELDLNFKTIEGNRTYATLYNALLKIVEASGHDASAIEKLPCAEAQKAIASILEGLGVSPTIACLETSADAIETSDVYALWHLLYSYEGDNSKTGNERLIAKLSERYGLSKEFARPLVGISYKDDYGSLSAKAIRKILPFLQAGHRYDLACNYAGYRHSKRSLSTVELDNKVLVDRLSPIARNSLRNPVVEKILNQMVHVVNQLVQTYGRPDEIRIELARDLKNNAKQRETMTKEIAAATKEQAQIRTLLKEQFGILNPSRNDIVRYRLYCELEKNGYHTLYSNRYIPKDRLFGKEIDIEHIIPQSRIFDDSYSNKTLEYREVNIEKADSTAYDYVATKGGSSALEAYDECIERLYNAGAISQAKRKKLKMKQTEIPDGFIERELRDSQYIAKKAREILEDLVRTVTPTTGSITGRLRQDWQLVDVMKELNWEKYDTQGLTQTCFDKDGRRIRRISDWTKRNDHRHHAMDALTIAFTKPSYIQYLNHLNARKNEEHKFHRVIDAIEKKELKRTDGKNLFISPIQPVEAFRAAAKEHLESLLVSIKAKNKVVTPNTNFIRRKKEKLSVVQLTPRGQLHNETIYGKIRQYDTRTEKINSSFTEEKIAQVALKRHRNALIERLHAFGDDPKKAFTGKNSPEKNPIFVDAEQTVPLPERVKLCTFKEVYTIRKAIDPNLNIAKVVDVRIRKILADRLEAFDNDPKKAFVGLDENPIWLNQEKNISLKRVTVSGVSNAIALHDKRDRFGKLLLDAEGKKQGVDYVNTSNNHHVAIYQDAEGNYQENVVSFFEATTRALEGLPVVDKHYNEALGWHFLFTMKQNEYFVFPNEASGFNPQEIDLLDPINYPLISPNLYRVQKFSSKDYWFRHHLEALLNDTKSLSGITYKRCTNLANLRNITKVRINHIGTIVAVGEE